MQCPECMRGVSGARCVCGWEAPQQQGAYQVAGEPRPICRTVGCAQAAMNGFAHCRNCDERIRREAAERRCSELGLTTVEAKKAYCKRLLRQGFRPASFERWAETITQEGVDTLMRMGTRADDKALERFRAMAVIDEHNQLIPHEKRAEVRERLQARRRAEAERLEAILKAQGVTRAKHEVTE